MKNNKGFTGIELVMAFLFILAFVIGCLAYDYHKSRGEEGRASIVSKIQHKIATPTVVLGDRYVLRLDSDSPWYDGSRDLYVTVIEIKAGWVLVRGDNGNTVDNTIKDFLNIFELVEAE